ncbi:DUF3429 domain-containing protein [Limobrevibacterium gyesilva]|uniref:DUF3429 domain-containing protein n=1 Tax=Limobrevibacterium gyesilva TaxID=2991712 RepID=A0AA42CEW3_9PROT|nr:DUF3429 domain-containing protein [Limobrevibacterium gyesilva]MCW3475789.1 DUF3429 domain-containing protein [Limobrevibacterium gyesilva]
MQLRLPPFALVLGIAGLIPFIVCGIVALSVPDERAAQYLTALMAYGAVVLAFLGGVHWGFVLGSPEDRSVRPRLALGVVPSLIGWLALLSPLAVPAEFGLALLILGYVGTVLGEARLYRQGLVPSGYMWMRWGLSLVVVATLVTVLTLRLLGAKIIF